MSYKNFDLNILLYARVGQTIQDNVLSTFQPDMRVNMMELNYWTPDNPTNDIPRLDPKRTASGYSELSSLTYTDGSFLKIRDITLGYRLPDSWIKRAKISRVRVYVSAKNPFIFSPYFNKPGGRWDPELNGSSSNNSNDGGASGGGLSTTGIGLPMPKMYAVGLNFEF